MLIKIFTTTSLVLCLMNAALAKDALSGNDLLSGGASSISETYGEWQLRCEIPQTQQATANGNQAAAADKGARPKDDGNKQTSDHAACSLRHLQRDEKTGMSLFMIELSIVPNTNNGAGIVGVIVLPFGIDVNEPWQLLPKGLPTQQLRVSTCLPIGCILPLMVSPDLEKALSQNADTTISGKVYEGAGPIQFLIKPDGFGKAIARLRRLSPPS